MRKLAVGFVLAVLILSGAAAFWFYGRLRASLPQLDGAAALAGLSAKVTIERDALGVPTISGATRSDVARALGYLHAQDRFFQMDLMRRRAAGELAELFGKAAVPLDRIDRRHGFRALAREILLRAPPEHRALIEAYTAGVNAGLAALSAKPFEYLVLRTLPEPWKPEDCYLVAYAMAITLHAGSVDYERSLGTLRDVYGARAVEFFAPLSSPTDAALDGTTAPLAPIPPPEAINLRSETSAGVGRDRWARRVAGVADPSHSSARPAVAPYPFGVDEGQATAGSNSFAISGSRTATGAALLANDMHLELSVPNTWYRASLHWNGRSITGVTLPGLPLIVAGSNGSIAWGLTNAQIDTSDLVVVTPTESPDFYRMPPSGAIHEFEHRHELIRVKGGPPVAVQYDWTIWGPVIGHNTQGRALALHWTLYDPRAISLSLFDLESAKTAKEAVAVAHLMGVPVLNFLVADSSGAIAWTIAGRLPKRVGYDGRFPVSWDYGDRRWEGLADPAAVPVIADPARSFLWTANNRPLGGAALRLLGDGGYERPARAAQIRDDLARLAAPVKPADLLSIELDDRALFLSRWRELMLSTLSPDSLASNKSRARLRAAVATWTGRADPASADFRLVRRFRQAVIARVLEPIFARCREADPEFTWLRFHYDDAVWTLVHARPQHLLAPEYKTWDDLLLAAADDVSQNLDRLGLDPAAATWGQRNTLRMRHPFARVLPAWLTNWLNMPAQPLPGDVDMPRVQTPDFGASERFVVSPGHESEGIFEMPGGQSGHPLSPFYRAGHQAWVRGQAASFLPGPAVHRLILQ